MNDAERRLKVQERLEDIKAHPDRHRHTFSGLTACCTIDGVLVLQLQEAHEHVGCGMNGGRQCDVVSGPCACGAWH